eukprot:TRINITY_DN35480_c0_g1_i2.p1 TRINITY_DN35480_c0_g1~~TRINITY_DN35480_c0_g1_i2.p1  ORF type:complete len:380 (+),score=117.79 TRINITY_DN35480_c0_g1_i2:75-1142(+)
MTQLAGPAECAVPARPEPPVVPHYQNYGDPRVQALMVGDRNRTAAYYRAIVGNAALFRGQTVLDVGAGQGILSMFAAKAGAARVYAVERSPMADVARALVESNGLSAVVEVLQEDLDRLQLPEQVDIIVSEWMGIGLVHERMLEVVLRARDRFLKEGGLLFPSTATLYLAPLIDDGAESELYARLTWETAEHYGLDWTAARRMMPYEDPGGPDREIAYPLQRVRIVPSRVAAAAQTKRLDLHTLTVSEAKDFTVHFNFMLGGAPLCDAYCLWFDVHFAGVDSDTRLGTGPADPPTHWRQLAWFWPRPLQVGDGYLRGTLRARAEEETTGYQLELEDSAGHRMRMNTRDFLWTEWR